MPSRVARFSIITPSQSALAAPLLRVLGGVQLSRGTLVPRGSACLILTVIIDYSI
jgi:hypothetical protein